MKVRIEYPLLSEHNFLQPCLLLLLLGTPGPSKEQLFPVFRYCGGTRCDGQGYGWCWGCPELGSPSCCSLALQPWSLASFPHLGQGGERASLNSNKKENLVPSLDGILSFCCVRHPAQLCVTCRLAEGALDLAVLLIMILMSVSPKAEP